MEFKTIRNTTPVLQYVMHKGTQVRLAPFGQEEMAVSLADKFLEKCAPAIVEVQIGESSAVDLPIETVWIANMSGNFDLPKTIKVRQHVSKGKREDVDVENPHLQPKSLTRDYDAGSVEKKLPDGSPYWYNLAKEPLTIPPYTRKRFSKEKGEWFLVQDARQMYGMANIAIRSRGPSEYEPDVRWALNDLRDYLRCIDPGAELGDSEEDLVKQIKREKLGKPEAESLLRDAKDRCFKRCLFRVFNPAYRLPTKAEFHEFKTGQSMEEIEQSQLSALLAKAEGQNQDESADQP